jgi:uncharacterized membrane protein YfcA
VDGARLPVYLATTGHEMLAMWPTVTAATAGVVIGTLFGHRLLVRIREERFRLVVAVTLGALGGAMLFSALVTGR